VRKSVRFQNTPDALLDFPDCPDQVTGASFQGSSIIFTYKQDS
jgi:hypothetical protein